MIPTANRRPVPVAFPTVPKRSAPAASKPTKAPENSVTGGMYASEFARELSDSFGTLNLHACVLDLLGNVLGAHVGGFNPELGEHH